MKTLKFEDKSDWKSYREGKITGSILDDVFSVKEITIAEIKEALDTAKIEYKKSASRAELLALLPETPQAKLTKKLEFYRLLAHKIAVPEEGDEDPMERGSRLEAEALEKFSTVIGAPISNELVMWVSDKNDSLASSPDGVIDETEVVETKCLSSAEHLFIYYEKEIPTKYEKQNLQAFIVNDNLQTLHFVCYDPRIPALPIHSITIKREDIADRIALYKQYEMQLMEELNRMAEELTF